MLANEAPSKSLAASEPKKRSRARVLLSIAQWIFVVVVIGAAIRVVANQWSSVRDRVMSLDIRWSMIIFASIIVFAVYGLLIETWRRMLAEWDARLGVGTATRIWFAAALGKYIPGYVWSLTAMGVMVKELGASPVAAAGSSVIVNVLNLASGITVALVCGAKLIPNASLIAAFVVVVIGAALTAPVVLPHAARWVGKLTGRNITVPHFARRVIWSALITTALAWIGYGLAFRLFAAGLLHSTGSANVTDGSLLLFIAVYAAAYIVGLVSPTPAGLGAREVGIMAGFAKLGVMSAPDAVIVAVTSRLWLTVLELVPGIIALAVTQLKTHARHNA